MLRQPVVSFAISRRRRSGHPPTPPLSSARGGRAAKPPPALRRDVLRRGASGSGQQSAPVPHPAWRDARIRHGEHRRRRRLSALQRGAAGLSAGGRRGHRDPGISRARTDTALSGIGARRQRSPARADRCRGRLLARAGRVRLAGYSERHWSHSAYSSSAQHGLRPFGEPRHAGVRSCRCGLAQQRYRGAAGLAGPAGRTRLFRPARRVCVAVLQQRDHLQLPGR